MENLAVIFKALSEEIRLRIINLLSTGELCVCDLMAVLGMPQSKVSRHLAYLRNAGWVRGYRNGKWMYYGLSQKLTPFQSKVLDTLMQDLEAHPQAGCDLETLESYMKTKSNRHCN